VKVIKLFCNQHNIQKLKTIERMQFGMLCCIYTVFQKNPCDYVFDDNLNSKRPILLIFGTVIT